MKIYIPIFTFMTSAFLLLGALVFQYGIGLYPCHLCLIQRMFHIIVIATSFAILLIPKQQRKNYLYLICIALMFLASLAGFYHVLVEHGIIASYCASVGDDTDIDTLLKTMPVVSISCDSAKWQFLSLSMAAWNGIISMLTALVGLMMMECKK